MKFKQEKIVPSSIWGFIRLPLTFLNGGFTLLEILVAILIVGILAAVAVPQYQRAVLKSRYASLMPIAKSMADSNEAYFLEHGVYAGNAQDLPVQGRNSYPDGTELEFGTSTDYAYVLATNPGVANNTYVVYQKHSKNFAATTQCEALTGDEQAEHVCQSFGGTPLDGSISGEEYTAYLLSGNGNGTFEKECKGPFTTEKECPSGCGVMTRDSAGCNTATGQWTEDGFDEDECPQPLETETEDCPAGYLGQRSREGNVCKNDNSGYTYGDWTENCQVDNCYHATSCSDGVPTACESNYYLAYGKCNVCSQSGITSDSKGATSCCTGYYVTAGSAPHYCYTCSSTFGSGIQTCSYAKGALTCLPGYKLASITSGTFAGTGRSKCVPQ